MLEIWQAVVDCTHIKAGFLVLNQNISDCNLLLPQDGKYKKLWMYSPHCHVVNLGKFLIKKFWRGTEFGMPQTCFLAVPLRCPLVSSDQVPHKE